MAKNDSSLQSQNPISQAMTHPTNQTVNQAYKSIAHAENAVSQAELSHSQEVVEQIRNELELEKEDLSQMRREP
ncbi:hypothetical protein [Paenibacillus larvae]|uniref:hypothetical protein n=1 Tax=Paenibacillus larvae TaxID=1464 RepID=UPI0001693905|nr:hypothetical protein [Paenibacillus larvae]